MTVKALFPASRPSLDLNFAKTKRLDPRITFSRSSTATYYGSDGLIKSAAVNEARFDHSPATGESLGLLVEEARTNVVTYSVIDGVHWSTTDGATITPNAALAPDGTFTAALVTFPGSNVPRINRSLTIGAGTVTQTVWIRAVAGTVTVRVGNPSDFGSNQTIGTSWTRVQATYSSGSNSFGIYCSNPVAAAQFYVWGAQMELGSFPTSYIPTPATFTSRASTATYYDANGVIQTAASGVARSNAFFPDSNGVMRPAGLLLEAAGTNQVTASVPTGTSPWSVSALTTVNTNATTAPDGTNTGTLVAADAGNTDTAYVSISFTSIPTECTVSFFAKDAGVGGCSGLINTTNGQWTFTYDFSTGITTVSNSAYLTKVTVTALANAWRRISVTISGTNTTFVRLNARASWGGTQPNGNSSTGVYFWGVQAEAGPYSTSYIPTSGSTVTRSADTSTSATVTRSADVCQLTGTNFSSWYNQSQGTIQVKLANINQSSANSIWSLDNTTSSQRIMFRVGVGTQVTGFSNISDTASPYTATHAFAIAADNLSGAKNGVLYSTPTGTGIPTVTQLQFGVGPSVNRASGHISRFTYWPTRLPDATLQALTAS